MTLRFTRNDFPDGFVFGTATAAYQVEGSRFGGAGPSHWDTFAATPGNVAHDENGATAADSYNRWREDLDLVQAGNFDGYRFSTSWPRIMPEGTGTPNPEGLDYYDRLVDGMLERGIKPLMTLHHWDMPAALADRGGWRNRDVASWFADFAEVVTDRLGDRVFATATLNEPWCIAWLSHFLGLHAPGMRDIRAASRAMHHVLLAHGTAMQRMRAKGQKNLGIVLNFEAVEPADDSPQSVRAAKTQEAIYNRWFLGGIFKGEYPAEALVGIEPHLPKGWQDDMAVIGSKLDWLGVNYYTRALIAEAPGLWPNTRQVDGPLPKTEMNWEIYPQGLSNVLGWIKDSHTGDLPLYVTENGMAARDMPDASGAVQDDGRTDFVDAHAGALRDAIAAGVPVKGYFIWSLMDNFEWALGYEKRFGLVRVDPDSLDRIPKASYHALAQALKRS